MAFEVNIFSQTRRAGEDLSAKQYHFVKLDTDGDVIACAASTDVAWGILQNKPGSLEPATVMRLGVSRLIAGGTLAIGGLVGPDSAGKGTLVTSGTSGTVAYPVARAEEVAASSGDIVAVSINTLVNTRAF